MKKQTVSFQFDTVPAHSRPLHLTDAAAGVLLLAGIWGLLWQCLRPESVPGLLGLGALAALGLAAGLLLRWDRKWQAGCPLRSAAGAAGGGRAAAEPHQRCSGGTGRLVGSVALSADRTVHAALCGGGQRLVDAAACGGCNGPCCGSCAAAALADMAGGRLRSRTAGAASGGPCAGGMVVYLLPAGGAAVLCAGQRHRPPGQGHHSGSAGAGAADGTAAGGPLRRRIPHGAGAAAGQGPAPLAL